MIQILTHFFSNFNLDKLETIERNPTIDIVVRTDCGYTCTRPHIRILCNFEQSEMAVM